MISERYAKEWEAWIASKMRPRPFADTDAGLIVQVRELQTERAAAEENPMTNYELTVRAERAEAALALAAENEAGLNELLRNAKIERTAAVAEALERVVQVIKEHLRFRSCTNDFHGLPELIRALSPNVGGKVLKKKP